MLKIIDNFLNKTTMYRIVLYVLIGLFIVSLGLSSLGFFPYSILAMISSLAVILLITLLTNIIFSRVFEAPTNVESAYITAFILFFLISPPDFNNLAQFLSLAIWASVWSMASKYILAINKKHIFNPAAFAVALTALSINQSASWWIGNAYLAPFVIIAGILIIRKIRRTDLVWSFLITALLTMIAFSLSRGANPLSTLTNIVLNTPLLFFTFVMLTEPLTAPHTRTLRIIYGITIGLLFAPAIHIGSIYSTPELVLLIGNIFAFIVSPKERLILKIKEVKKIATDTFEFIFASDRNLSFNPGQYMEWTLAHKRPDSRGNRRYFTLASSPTEPDIKLGLKFYPNASSFKTKLAELKPGDTIIASQRSGDFTLPKDKKEKSVFIAGGIGVTPFRSMIKYLLDNKEHRAITILYCNKTAADIAYKDIFNRAQTELDIKTVYINSDQQGLLNPEMIKQEVPDYLERSFYISGPHGVVTAFEKTLKNLGIRRNKIKTDFFPGFV